MARFTVTHLGETLGWFEESLATAWDDGQNHLGDHERLYRTAEGRWVVRHSDDLSDEVWATYVDDDQAGGWLLRFGYDADYVRLFGPIVAERGPGRPAIGPKVELRLPTEDVEAADAAAALAGSSRAEVLRNWIRRGRSQ